MTIRDVPPEIHRPNCYHLISKDAFEVPARKAHPLARPHQCLTMSDPVVWEVVVEWPDHEYVESMIWPAGEARSRCRTCRGIHE